MLRARGYPIVENVVSAYFDPGASVPVCYFFKNAVFAREKIFLFSQHIPMDPSARISMKDAAKCDKHCDWQNSANQ